MTPALIKAEAAKAALTGVSLPSCSVVELAIDSGPRARCVATYMRVHALESVRWPDLFADAALRDRRRQGTNDAAPALQANGRPVANSARRSSAH
jgi:hypothetical protein